MENIWASVFIVQSVFKCIACLVKHVFCFFKCIIYLTNPIGLFGTFTA